MSVAFLACSPTNTDMASSTAETTAVEPLYATHVVRPFSDKARPDTLSVSINGESILTGRTSLRIVDSNGKLIYTSTFPTQALLDHEGLIKPKEDEQTIKTRIDNFFKPEHFTTPFQASDSIKMAWKGVRVDPDAICFSYPVSKDSLRLIAYSKSGQKVVQVTGASK